jgi:hypothetical protein
LPGEAQKQGDGPFGARPPVFGDFWAIVYFNEILKLQLKQGSFFGTTASNLLDFY